MKELAAIVLDVAQSAGASFADFRYVEERENRVIVERRSLKEVDETEKSGYSVRILLNGAWGFAFSTLLNKDVVLQTARRAIAIARASRCVPKPVAVEFAEEATHIDTRIGSCIKDPFQVSNSEKADYLLTACDIMLQVPGITTARGVFWFSKIRRVLANSDGSYLELTNWFSNPMLQATAVVNGESQDRNYAGGARQAGYEFIDEIDLAGNANRWAKEAVLKTKADESPRGMMDLVLDPHHLALTMHESVGHPTELDRILGWEANMAGRSFVEPEDIGSLRYGNDLVNFTVDNTLKGGLGSWFYDDDGVEMKRFPLIQNGVLANVATTRETAPLIGLNHSNGCCRAQGYQHFPINRQPNLYMEPGENDDLSPSDLIAGVDRGVCIQGRGSFSIDQMRNNFQFGGDMFWMIENGKLTKPLKKVTYQAQTRQFWNSCDAIAGKKFWEQFGIWNCGKGEPVQRMIMTHGASHCRFRNIRVGEALS
jgi:TldD protein